MLPNLCRLPVLLATTVLLELLLIAYVLSLSVVVEFDWARFARMSLYLQIVALSAMGLLCQSRQFINRLSRGIATALVLILVCGVVVAANLIWQLLLGTNVSALDWRWLLRDCLIAIVLGLIALRYVYLQQRWIIEQQVTERARFEALQARIQPHFLFNTLNSIAALIAVSPDKAEAAIQDLSLLLRKQINGDRDRHTWLQEREICEAYLGIETLRYGDRLGVEWQVDSVPDDMALPPLLLQPLLENAIRHGIAKMKESGWIRVYGERLEARGPSGEEHYKVCVENGVDTDFLPYADADSDRLMGAAALGEEHGIALANVRARVAAFFRDERTGEERASVKVEILSGLCRISLQMPYLKNTAVEGLNRDR